MPLSLDNYKLQNATMYIPGEERDYLTKSDYRRLCDDIVPKDADPKSLAMTWPSQELFDMVKHIQSIPMQLPDKIGTAEHKYYQTGAELATFKCSHQPDNQSSKYRTSETGVLYQGVGTSSKWINWQRAIPREECYDLMCRAHAEGLDDNGNEITKHRGRDAMHKQMLRLTGDVAAVSKTQCDLFIKRCRHPVCINNQKVAEERKAANAAKAKEQTAVKDNKRKRGNKEDSPVPRKTGKKAAARSRNVARPFDDSLGLAPIFYNNASQQALPNNFSPLFSGLSQYSPVYNSMYQGDEGNPFLSEQPLSLHDFPANPSAPAINVGNPQQAGRTGSMSSVDRLTEALLQAGWDIEPSAGQDPSAENPQMGPSQQTSGASNFLANIDPVILAQSEHMSASRSQVTDESDGGNNSPFSSDRSSMCNSPASSLDNEFKDYSQYKWLQNGRPMVTYYKEPEEQKWMQAGQEFDRVLKPFTDATMQELLEPTINKPELAGRTKMSSEEKQAVMQAAQSYFAYRTLTTETAAFVYNSCLNAFTN